MSFRWAPFSGTCRRRSRPRILPSSVRPSFFSSSSFHCWYYRFLLILQQRRWDQTSHIIFIRSTASLLRHASILHDLPNPQARQRGYRPFAVAPPEMADGILVSPCLDSSSRLDDISRGRWFGERRSEAEARQRGDPPRQIIRWDLLRVAEVLLEPLDERAYVLNVVRWQVLAIWDETHTIP